MKKKQLYTKKILLGLLLTIMFTMHSMQPFSRFLTYVTAQKCTPLNYPLSSFGLYTISKDLYKYYKPYLPFDGKEILEVPDVSNKCFTKNISKEILEEKKEELIKKNQEAIDETKRFRPGKISKFKHPELNFIIKPADGDFYSTTNVSYNTIYVPYNGEKKFPKGIEQIINKAFLFYQREHLAYDYHNMIITTKMLSLGVVAGGGFIFEKAINFITNNLKINASKRLSTLLIFSLQYQLYQWLNNGLQQGGDKYITLQSLFADPKSLNDYKRLQRYMEKHPEKFNDSTFFKQLPVCIDMKINNKNV